MVGGTEGGPGFLSQKTLLEADIKHQLLKATFVHSNYRGVPRAAWEPLMRNDSHGGQLFSAKVATNHPISTEPFVCWSQGPLVCGLCSSEEPGSGHKGAKTPPPTPRARSGFPTSGSTRKMIPTCIVSSYCALLNPGPCTRPPFMGPQSAATPPVEKKRQRVPVTRDHAQQIRCSKSEGQNVGHRAVLL